MNDDDSTTTQQQRELIPIRERYEVTQAEEKKCLETYRKQLKVELQPYDDKAKFPRPTYDTKDYGIMCPHRTYHLFPLYELPIEAGRIAKIDTGWSLYGYPASTHTLQLRLTSSAVKMGVSTSLHSLDSLLGQYGHLNRIVVPVRNNNETGTIYIHPDDNIFEICLIPKIHFCMVVVPSSSHGQRQQ